MTEVCGALVQLRNSRRDYGSAPSHIPTVHLGLLTLIWQIVEAKGSVRNYLKWWTNNPNLPPLHYSLSLSLHLLTTVNVSNWCQSRIDHAENQGIRQQKCLACGHKCSGKRSCPHRNSSRHTTISVTIREGEHRCVDNKVANFEVMAYYGNYSAVLGKIFLTTVFRVSLRLSCCH